MNIATCGLDCAACTYMGNGCSGCKAIQGKPFWAESFGMEKCPVYACAEEKGYGNCGSCKEIPCEKWENLREPGVTDEQHAANIQARKNNLCCV